MFRLNGCGLLCHAFERNKILKFQIVEIRHIAQNSENCLVSLSFQAPPTGKRDWAEEECHGF